MAAETLVKERLTGNLESSKQEMAGFHEVDFANTKVKSKLYYEIPEPFPSAPEGLILKSISWPIRE